MSTIRELYLSALKKLDARVSPNDLRLLLLEMNHFANYAELDIYQNKEVANEIDFWKTFERLNNGEPVQYIVHNANFYGHDYYVDKNVLIPRPETEELVNYALQDIQKKYHNQSLVLVDVGTGSGVIAIECARQLPNAEVHAVDISTEALAVAKKNADTYQTNITFHQGNMLTPLITNKHLVDVIISNPPYINAATEIDRHVLDYEPHLALFASHGIDFYQEIITQSVLVKKDHIHLYFEIGEDQEPLLSVFLHDYYPHIKPVFKKDLQGKTRFLFIDF